MTEPTFRLARVIEAIDRANAADPHLVAAGKTTAPAERLYGERMSAALERLAPDAGEALMIAARGQHVERWKTPRALYPEGRAGYLKWRTDQKVFHARRLAEIMAPLGYDEAEIERVGALVRKERFKQDPEAQILEDVACLVFLDHYAAEFAEQHDDDKISDILAKTWAKMSPAGHAAALKLSLAPRLLAALRAGLARRGVGR